jgi:tRNA threonylcarbamoyladenosine biosynthesis protein TsaE
MKSIISHSLEETKKIATDWLTDISTASKSAEESTGAAMVVGLCGPLGSGKTAFIQAVARAAGVANQVTSPTFVIMKFYESRVGPWNRLVHVDAYRLGGAAELEPLDFEAIVSNPNNLVLIEWADNVEAALPADWRRIDFETLGENERSITFAQHE